MMKIATTQVWVHDQEAALRFYTEKLGMEIHEDVTLAEMGNFRWLTVGPKGQSEMSIVLMAVPGPPMIDAQTQQEISPGSTFRGTGQGQDQSDLIDMREQRERAVFRPDDREVPPFQVVGRGSAQPVGRFAASRLRPPVPR